MTSRSVGITYHTAPSQNVYGMMSNKILKALSALLHVIKLNGGCQNILLQADI